MLKYASQYGVSRHVAAAYVIGRRGIGLQERLPKRLIASLPQIADQVRADIVRLKAALERAGTNKDTVTAKVAYKAVWLNF